MKAKYRNIFILFGLAAIAIMLLSFDMDYTELWHNIRRAGYWFAGVVGVWVFIYFFNTLSWFYIIRNGERPSPVPFWHVYKLSVSGFALNYATPCGLMGGEPYRIMELSPILGTARATSSVILYVMMHIFSHICFWFSAVLLYIIMYSVSFSMGVLLFFIGACCLLAIYFFMKGYKNGMVVKTFRLMRRLPFVKGWATRFYERKQTDLERIDSQIAALHNQKPSTFYMSFLYEFLSRFLTSLEVFFILKILTPEVNIFDCVLIMAFTSLFSNLFFFSPMQLGAREGGFALAVSGLSLSGAFGVYASLITRVRELIWIVIGVALMKVGNRRHNGKSTESLALTSDSSKIKGLLFDFGGTLDTGGRHWANVLWEGYRKTEVPITEEAFREAYIYTERYLAKNRVILPEDNFLVLLQKKIHIELTRLQEETSREDLLQYEEGISKYCYGYAHDEVQKSKAVLERLTARYPLVLVTNFYGNMHAVVQDFGLSPLFKEIVESAVVGVRKPDTEIWRLGVKALGCRAEEACVVGDSFDKDIEPARQLGCKTVWFKGEEWAASQHDETAPDAVITSIEGLLNL